MPKAPTIKDSTRRQSKRQATIGHKNKSSVEPEKRRVRRKLSGDDEPSDASEPVAFSRRPPLPPDANTKGLPTFPMELHLEILSYLPSVPIPCMQSGILSEEYRIKFDVMFTLSQTCRALYHLLKPLLWETLEACALRAGRSTERPKAMATELVLWLEVVTVRAPALASYVRVFNVALTTFSAHNVYQEFTRCLQLLPNLHTLQIVSFTASADHEKQMCLRRLANAFKGDITLPSIHTVTIPLCIYENIVASDGPRIFPNLRHLNLTEIRDSDLHPRMLPVTFRPCTQEIHSLQLSRGVRLNEPDILHFISMFPHLRVTPRLRIPYRRYPWDSEEDFTNTYIPEARKAFQALSCLTQLHTILLDTKTAKTEYWDSDEVAVDPLVMENVCNVAEKVILRNLDRAENADVVEGKVKVCGEDSELEISIRVARPYLRVTVGKDMPIMLAKFVWPAPIMYSSATSFCETLILPSQDVVYYDLWTSVVLLRGICFVG
ncbi:hypothetical protein BDZ89DRAFT_1181260 [Hymenopellis radicata]|nr:hypothetical protein BDZ89DRAFT_1181260 [Hymenopellis radicata]